jgi:hypothetical protein
MTSENSSADVASHDHAHRAPERTSPSIDYIETNPQQLVDLGWRIFPVHGIVDGRCTCGKPGCSAAGKHPRTKHGVKDASKIPEVIATWQHMYPLTNWGLACGTASNIVVLDVDVDKGGFASLAEFEAGRGEPLPPTLTARTGSGGRHYFFRPVQGQRLRNRVSARPGVDFRSDGGYVVVPPAHHASGGRYAWESWGSTIAELPLDLALSIEAAPAGRSTADDRSTSQKGTSRLPDIGYLREHGFAKGERDAGFYALACQLWRYHWPYEELVVSRAHEVWLATDQPAGDSFPWELVLRKIERAREFVEPQVIAERQWFVSVRRSS